MKSALVASLGLCTLATASANHPRHPHFNYRRQNDTTTAGGEQVTTLTVLTTSVHTVLSCAASITNCPVGSSAVSALAATSPEAVETVAVTDTIQLWTTICPVTAAESVTSSVYSAAATGGLTGVTLLASSTAPVATSPAATSGSSPEGQGAPSAAASGSAPGAGFQPSGVAYSSGVAPAPTAGPSGITSIGAQGTSASTATDDETCEDETSVIVSTVLSTLTSAVPVTVTITEAGSGGSGSGNVVVSTSTSLSVSWPVFPGIGISLSAHE